MAKKNSNRSKSSNSNNTATKRTRTSQTDVPAHTLDDALRIPRAIHENYGGDPTKPFDVAAALDLKPGSTQFKMLAGASIAYGLTEGGYNAVEISISDLGKTIICPLEEGVDIAGKREALLKPRVLGEFLRKYDGSPLPKENIAHNVLLNMGVPASRTDAVFSMIIESANTLGLIREIKGVRYINLVSQDRFELTHTDEPEVSTSIIDTNFQEEASGKSSDVEEHCISAQIHPQELPQNRRVFITHGRNKTFIDPIKKLLKFGELEAVVSVDKQSVSKPVPEKVMADMRLCGAAIIHVEDEMHLMDSEANEHVVLNPNVLIEIGAAMGLYGRRFILLVKDGVKLPSNLQGLYEVRYQGDSLDGDATIKLLEAINAMKSETNT